jgi:sorting nexin-8
LGLGAGLESDPWGSPELHRNHNHETSTTEERVRDGFERVVNGFGGMRPTTNAWSGGRAVEETRQSEAPQQQQHTNGRNESAPPSSSGSGWGGHIGGPPGDDAFGAGQPPALGGFGPPGDDPSEIGPQRRSMGLSRPTNAQVEEHVTITLLQEKEGMFMFQHRNYEVKSPRRGSTVVRRYSDFVWLLDCLQKRFPFRQLPLLPPKRVSGTFNSG